jgi:hypothetical protein
MFSNIPEPILSIGLAVIGGVAGWILSRFLERRAVQRALHAAQDARKSAFESLRESAPAQYFRGTPEERTFVVEKISITNFKNIEQLTLDLMRDSSLKGNWSCIAGINGAGKSAILQALCIVLLGEKYAAELGSTRLGRMIRRTPDGPLDSAKIEAWIRLNGESLTRVAIPLFKEGVDEVALRSDPDYSKMRQLWEDMKTSVLVSYGAARNLSQDEERKHESQASRVQRQMTLFDPLTRIADVEVLVKAGAGNENKRRTLKRLLEKILDKDELQVWTEGDRLKFGRTGTRVDAIDLPDGFRSTVAWLADLCAAWHDSAPEGSSGRDTDPSRMTGIVLIDEIDLHLHPSMARSIVPRLREVLPHVQFIVTTHSPLVLGSFDFNELIVLEADEQGVVSTRSLDRQVFGFSMDEIYKWLMRTPPHSTVLEEKAERGDDPNLASYLYQSPAISSDHAGVNAEDSQLLVNDLERLLKDVKSRGTEVDAK